MTAESKPQRINGVQVHPNGSMVGFIDGHEFRFECKSVKLIPLELDGKTPIEGVTSVCVDLYAAYVEALRCIRLGWTGQGVRRMTDEDRNINFCKSVGGGFDD